VARTAITLAALVLWLAGVTAGFKALWQVDNAPGSRALEPVDWPASSHVAREPGRPTLVLFAHPRCPCTRASLAELDSLLARAGGPLAVRVLFVRPRGAPEGFERTASLADARGLAGVEVAVDADGAEARRFGVATSGHVLLYDADGRLRFGGGITASRGHRGDSAGRAAVLAILRGAPFAEGLATAPVYGCPLFDEGDGDGDGPGGAPGEGEGEGEGEGDAPCHPD